VKSRRDRGCHPDQVQYAQNYHYRYDRVIKEIQGIPIICLQEVDRLEDIFGPRLTELGYEMVVNIRKVTQTNLHTDGVLIAWLSDFYEKIEHQEIQYNDVF